MALAAYRILIVDDNKDSATTLALLLKYSGHETELAWDGLQAIEAVESFSPDVILLDIGLPQLNGFEVCQRIRAKYRERNIVIIAVTGWGQDDYLKQAQQAGFDSHMLKPVSLDSLLSKMATLMPNAK